MIRRQMEDRRHLRCCLTLADQAEIGAAAKRQSQRVEQDGFAGTCLAREHGQAVLEGQRQPLDQNDIGDRQAVQHG